MRRVACAAIVGLLTLGLGCAKKMTTGESSIIGAESLTKRFRGYRTAVEIKAPVAELEKLLLDPRILQMNMSLMRMEFLSGDNFSRLGDRAEYNISSLGLNFRVRAILVHYEPQKEIWYTGQGGTAIMLFRFGMEELGEGTRLNLSCEILEEGGPDFQQLAQLIDIYKLIAQGFEGAAANLQVRFDPSLSKDALLARGLRGEFFEAFYVGHKLEMQIEAAPERVFQVFTTPAFWRGFEEETGSLVSPCFYELRPGSNTGVCPVEIELFGDHFTLDTILSAHSFEKRYFNYFFWGDSRFQFAMNPTDQGGTRLSVFYLMPSSKLTDPALFNLAVNFGRIPEQIKKKVLPAIKSRAEQKG